MLFIDRVEKRFGQVPALQPTTLTVEKGEFFSLLGPSGCGKTTLMRLIAGFERPTAGDIWFDGRSIVNLPPARRPTIMIFQHLALFPHMTVRQNVSFGLEMKRLAPAEIKRRVGEALALVHMEELLDRPVTQLSGGQRQRVAIARAVVTEPNILLLDEPLSALDQKLRVELQEELKKIQRRVGSTFIFVTHDQHEALTLSDRIAVFNKGSLQQVGSSQEIYRNPGNRFVAEFVGKSNVLEGMVRDVAPDGVHTIEYYGKTYRRPLKEQYRVGERISFLLRYEDITIGEHADAPGMNGRIAGYYYAGSSINFEVQLEDGAVVKVEHRPLDGTIPFEIGQPVRVTLSFERALVF